MSQIQYDQMAHLSDGHSKGITGVTFSPDGSLLASSGLDGSVCVWDTKTWLLVDIYYAKTPVTSVAWFNESSLVCGLKDGILSSLVKTDDDVTCVNGFWAHVPPIEHVSTSGKYVASGAHHELSVWDWNCNTSLTCLVAGIQAPSNKNLTKKASNLQDVDGGEVLITGIFWTSTSLIATYLHHGIRFFDRKKWRNVRVIDTDRPIIASSLSPDGAYLASSNLVSGFEIYALGTETVTQSFDYPTGTGERAIPVSFVHGGYAILGGSTVGHLNVWYLDVPITLGPLRVPNNEQVLAISAHYDAMADRFFIAAGVMNEHSASSVVVWAAQPCPSDELSAEEVEYMLTPTTSWQSVCRIAVYWVVLPFLILVIAGVLIAVMKAGGVFPSTYDL